MRRTGILAAGLISLAGGLAAGCAAPSLAPVEPDPPPIAAAAPPRPAPRPPQRPAEDPKLVALPAEAPAQPPPPLPPEPARVLVLLPPQSDTFASVLPALEAELAARRIVADRATLDSPATDADGAEAPSVVVAVGTAATSSALERPGMPVVFCQVPDFDFEAPDAFGVASIPPLDLQLEAWRRLDPALRTIGLVLGDDEAPFAAEAVRAAAAHGLVLDVRLVSSDQEAVYHVRRMVAHVDGLWLLPDDTALSPRAIRDMLDLASMHDVQTLVFSPALLEWGALLSVAPTDTDLARTLAHVVGTLVDGRRDELPPTTALLELEARVNLAAADRLGLEPVSNVWIERSEAP